MHELFIRLNLAALTAMSEGHELVLDCDGTRVCIRCDDEAVEAFQDAVQKSLLHMLPTTGSVH